MERILLFNKIGVSVSINDLMKKAGITEIENGMGYTLNEPLFVWGRKMNRYKIVDFCINPGKVSECVIGIQNSAGCVEEYYADWYISCEEKKEIIDLNDF